MWHRNFETFSFVVYVELQNYSPYIQIEPFIVLMDGAWLTTISSILLQMFYANYRNCKVPFEAYSIQLYNSFALNL